MKIFFSEKKFLGLGALYHTNIPSQLFCMMPAYFAHSLYARHFVRMNQASFTFLFLDELDFNKGQDLDRIVTTVFGVWKKRSKVMDFFSGSG